MLYKAGFGSTGVPVRYPRSNAVIRSTPGVGYEVDAVLHPQPAIGFFAPVVKTKAALGGRNGRVS